jgi:hypothetical protein
VEGGRPQHDPWHQTAISLLWTLLAVVPAWMGCTHHPRTWVLLKYRAMTLDCCLQRRRREFSVFLNTRVCLRNSIDLKYGFWKDGFGCQRLVGFDMGDYD